MASTKGLNIEIEGASAKTIQQAHAVVRTIMQSLRIPRLPHERFDMSVDTIIGDAARVLGASYYEWHYGTDGYTFVFDFDRG